MSQPSRPCAQKRPEKPGITYPDYPYRTHAIDFVDVDGDGRPEIAVSEGGPARSPDYVREPDRLFKVEMHPASRWMLVHPVGDGVNVSMDAIGTRGAATVVIGCVYLYPSATGEWDVTVQSWVRADHSSLDAPLADAVARWLAADWPWNVSTAAVAES